MTCLVTLFKYVLWLSFLLNSLYFLFKNFCLLQWCGYYSCIIFWNFRILLFIFTCNTFQMEWHEVVIEIFDWISIIRCISLFFLVVPLFSLTLISMDLILVSLLYPLFYLSSLGPISVIHCCIFLLWLSYKMLKIYQILIFHLLKWSHIFSLLNNTNNFKITWIVY